jgi:hypothetical protein
MAGQIQRVYQLILTRTPNRKEVARAKRFLTEYAASYRILPSVEDATLVRPVVEKTSQGKPVGDPDDLERTGQIAAEKSIEPKTAEEGARMSLVQALYASAEFRFIR